MSIYEDFMNQTNQTEPQGSTGNSIYDSFMGQQAAPPQEDNSEKSIYDIVGDAGRALTSPASTALEAISYLDKPRGAIAGGVNAMLNNQDILDGVASGWKNNTSWGEALPEEFKKEHPTLSSVAGFVGDVALDPMWFLPPAKLAKGIAAGSKAIGLTDHLINPAINTVKNSELGAKAIAGAEDALGVNRLEKSGILDEFNSGMASDAVKNADYTDALGDGFRKAAGEYADDATKYLEAADRPTAQATTMPTSDILNSVKEGKAAEQINQGAFTREEAFNALRESGEEIPDYLLQTHQKQARQEIEDTVKNLRVDIKVAQDMGDNELADRLSNSLKEIVSNPNKEIPDYIYRDQVLSAIPDENIRNVIKNIAEPIIAKNKEYSDAMYNLGRIGDEEFVQFLNGSHLRRSYEKYESAEDFLKDVKKNGTPEEWQKAYSDYQKNKGGVGPSQAHKIDQRDFMRRQNLSEETLKKMGVVNDTQYRVMDTFNRASKTINEEKFLRKVDDLFGKTEEEAAVLSRNLPKSREYVPISGKQYGALDGKWVPRDVANQVMGTLGTRPDNINKTWQKMVSWWKVGKLAAPAPIMRNFYSGLPMANVFGRVPLAAIPKEMAKIAAAYKSGGKNSPLIRELRSSGALEGEWVGNELKNILGGKTKNPITKAANFGMEAFGLPDKFWRGVVYSYHRGQGKSVQEAGSIARKALLDYSSAPNWVNTLSKTGVMPFAKFPFMAGKETAKALWHNPAEVTKYSKAQNQVNNEDRNTIMPDYMKSRTLLPIGDDTRIVNGKPQKVQQNIDLSYILPFASDFSFGNPLTDAAMLYKTGRNGIGQQVIKPGMTDKEKAAAWAEYIANSALPSITSPYSVEKAYNAYKGNVDSKGRLYEPMDAFMQVGLGVKNAPVNIDETFKSRMNKIKMDQRDISSMITTIKNDQSMNEAQKREKIAEHVSQTKELQKEAKKVLDAYRREKQRGAN